MRCATFELRSNVDGSKRAGEDEKSDGELKQRESVLAQVKQRPSINTETRERDFGRDLCK